MKVGLERLAANPSLAAAWGRCGLLCNQASITADWRPAWQVLQDILGRRLTTLFGPQQGFEGTAQDNMIETEHYTHRYTDLPIYSLYSEHREPTEEMFANLDTIIIDLQITGCRIYTFKSTIAACLRAAVKFKKQVVVLDRPNPVGGEIIEGRVLDADVHSFVGEFPIPMRHGMTAAEAALFFNKSIKAELTIIELEGWSPSCYWCDLQRPWVLTTPNLPTADSVMVFPGMVLFEGVNLSEGRGTTLPFQLLGAPYLKDGRSYIKRTVELLGGKPSGLHLRDASFEPVAQKWAGTVCHGLQIHVTESSQVRSFPLAVAMIRAAIELGGDGFGWKPPPYEYDFETLPIKLILGSSATADKFTDRGFDVRDDFWSQGINDYMDRVRPSMMYQRTMTNGHLDL